MSRYSDQIRDEYGRLIPGVSIYVYKWDAYTQVAGDLETLADDLAAPLVNPLTSDADGLYYFNSADGQKLLEYHFGGKVQERTLILVGALPVPQATFGGLFVNASALTIPVGMDMIGTDGADALDHGGANYVAGTKPTARSGFTSANTRNFALSKEQTINPRMFYDATDSSFSPAMAAAVDYINVLGGGAMFIPKDSYTLNTYVPLCHKLRIFGDGPTSSIFTSAHAGGGGANAFENLRNGSSFASIDPVNVSTAADITLEDIAIINTNPASQGAAFFQRGGTFVTLNRVTMRGHRFGGAYSQTELLTSIDCRFETQVNNGAGEWYINGNDLGDGAVTSSTNNAISIRPQYNQLTGIPDLIHDGGYNYTTINPNFNGGLRAARFAGVVGLLVISPAVESMDQDPFLFDATSYYGGVGVSSCSGEFKGGVISAPPATVAVPGGFGCFKFFSGGTIKIGGGITLATSTGASIRGCSNIFTLETGALSTTYAGDPLIDSFPTNGLRPALYQAAAPIVGFHRAGEIVFPQVAAAGSVLFWRCIVDGTPGTWEAFGARQAGWTADTGTAKRTTNATYAAGTTLTYSAAYVQAEQTAMATRMAAVEAALQNATQAQKAVKDDLIAYRIIGA